MRRSPLSFAAVVALTLSCRAASADKPASAPPARADAAPSPAPAAALPLHLIGRQGEAMGTIVEIKVWAADDEKARSAIGEAFDEIARIERLMTTWREDSDISRVNAAAGLAPVVVAPETFECLARSLEYSRRSHGAFDVTYYALKGLWKFDQDLEAKLPDPAEVRRRIKLIDYRKLILDEQKRTVYLAAKGMRINLGGIAKGYAVDRATAILRARGYKDAIVQAGGDLMLSGTKSGKPWNAGIRDPRSRRDDYFAVAAVTDHAFSTAGDYERYFFIKGKRYHHIIDPKTGYPATAARSVTIWAPDATTADGLDDAVLIMGAKAGLAMIDAMPGVGAVVIDNQNQVHVSKSMEGVVTILRQPTPGP